MFVLFIQDGALLSFPLSFSQAIKIFTEARPPGIYKPDYIDALYSFYHERKPEMVVCPPTPEWKRSSELDLNGEAVPGDNDNGVPTAPLHVCTISGVLSSIIFFHMHFFYSSNDIIKLN